MNIDAVMLTEKEHTWKDIGNNFNVSTIVRVNRKNRLLRDLLQILLLIDTCILFGLWNVPFDVY